MNYQVKWDAEGNWENVYPDGMHSDETHGGATLENVLDEEAFILIHGNNAVRLMTYQHSRTEDEENGEPYVEGDDSYETYAVAHFFNYAMPDNAILKEFDSKAEAEDYLRAEYPDANYQFDDDYQCAGCWNPETGDPDVWFAAIFEQGAEAARCGHGSVNQYEYTREEWEAKRRKEESRINLKAYVDAYLASYSFLVYVLVYYPSKVNVDASVCGILTDEEKAKAWVQEDAEYRSYEIHTLNELLELKG